MVDYKNERMIMHDSSVDLLHRTDVCLLHGTDVCRIRTDVPFLHRTDVCRIRRNETVACQFDEGGRIEELIFGEVGQNPLLDIVDQRFGNSHLRMILQVTEMVGYHGLLIPVQHSPKLSLDGTIRGIVLHHRIVEGSCSAVVLSRPIVGLN